MSLLSTEVLDRLQKLMEHRLEVEREATPGPWRFIPDRWNQEHGDNASHSSGSIGAANGLKWWLFLAENAPQEKENVNLVLQSRNFAKPDTEFVLGAIRVTKRCQACGGCGWMLNGRDKKGDLLRSDCDACHWTRKLLSAYAADPAVQREMEALK